MTRRILLLLFFLFPPSAWAVKGTANQVSLQDGTIAFANNPIRVNEGGTGAASFANTNQPVVVGSTTTGALSSVAAGTAANVLVSAGASAPTWTTINLASANAVGASILAFANGGTGLSTAADDTILNSNGSAWSAVSVPNCTDVTGNHLNYTAASNSFTCGTSSSSGTPTIQFAIGTNGDITAASTSGAPLFISFAGVDTREDAVQMPINSTTRAWNNIRCVSSGVPGGTSYTIRLRKGACGSQADVTATDCAITAAATTCGPINSAQSVASAGHCLDWSVFATGATNTVRIVCTVEQTA